MLNTKTSRRSRHNGETSIDIQELGQVLRHCHDLTYLQNSDLVYLPGVVRRCRGESVGLHPAIALRKELIAVVQRISRRTTRFPIRKILKAIEERRLGSDSQRLVEIQKRLGIPFSRNRIDLARYYAIRLVMEGLSNETIAEFLMVDPRTLANYIAQAKMRIVLILGSR